MTSTDFDEHERQQWAGSATAYQRSFASLCAAPADALLDAAEVTAGKRVLDVGTGPGTVAALALQRGAAVSAVDAEPSMVAVARDALPDIEVRHGILPDLPFPGQSFDAAVANFVINHVGDPAAAIAELRRVVRSGGRVAVTIWPYPQPPLQRLWARSSTPPAHRAVFDVPSVAPDRDFARTHAGLNGLLRAAEVTAVGCTAIRWTHRVDPEDWWTGRPVGSPASAGSSAAQTEDMIVHLRRTYDRLAAAHLDQDGLLALPTAALVGSGRVA